MKLTICILGISVLLAGPASGAILYLENAADGSASMELAPGEAGELSIVLYLHPIDTNAVFVGLSLESDDDELAEDLPITDVLPGDWPEDYDYPDDLLPATFGEFSIVFGDPDEPLEAPITVVLATLVITHTGTQTSGSLAVAFEGGARQPTIFTSDFGGYVWDTGLAGVISNFVDPGVGGEDNPFMINLVPAMEECDGDANGDGVVDPMDSGFILARFGCDVDTGNEDCDAADQNGDGVVDPLDTGFVLARFGECP